MMTRYNTAMELIREKAIANIKKKQCRQKKVINTRKLVKGTIVNQGMNFTRTATW
jgi:hypothetical protein